MSGNSLDWNAVLCTPDKTYCLRQVNHSNSVYITQPAALHDDEHDQLDRRGIEAIAQTMSVLEPSLAKNVSAVPYLKALLPVYASTGLAQSKDARGKDEVFADVPLSDTECEQAWTELACFELAESSACFIPSATVRLQAWKSIFTHATAAGIDLTTPLNSDNIDQLAQVDEDLPEELSQAVLRSVCGSKGSLPLVDEERCIRLVGLINLECQPGVLPMTSFLRAWQDSLPEKWRSKVDVTLLKPHYHVDGASIRYAGHGPDSNVENDPEIKSTLGAKRKWHDKFRSSKKPS